MAKFFSFCLVMFFASSFSFAGVSFGNIDLNNNNELIYTVSHNIPGLSKYKSLFYAPLGTQTLEAEPALLTCYPEHIYKMNDDSSLYIQNRYGMANYSFETNSLTWISKADSLPTSYTKQAPILISPDGAWLCYVNPTGRTEGSLILENAGTHETVIVVEKQEFKRNETGVLWAPDSKCFLYEKNGDIYFAEASSLFGRIQLEEKMRKIGHGSINSVRWTKSGSLVYIDGDIAYLIQENELYTRSLYSSVLGSGTVLGRLVSHFDYLHDKFFVDNEGSRLIVLSGSSLVAFYNLQDGKFSYAPVKGLYTLSSELGPSYACDVFWGDSSNVYLWADSLSYAKGEKVSTVYSIKNTLVPVLSIKNSSSPLLSPNGRLLAFSCGKALYVYDVYNWKRVASLQGQNIASFLWEKDSLSLYVGGVETLVKWTLPTASVKDGETEVLYISSVNSAYWAKDEIIAFPSAKRRGYKYTSKTNSWELLDSAGEQKELSGRNEYFRVYTDSARNNIFDNSIYVRSFTAPGVTYPLYAECDSLNTEKKRVALVFDAVGATEGLSNILNTLDEFNVDATFFINGEFIRRYPLETRQIASSSYSCASGFFSSANLVDNTFIIDEDFIKRGLARNEDEFLDATGRELSLYWHAPQYKVNEKILIAGKNAGYRYVNTMEGFSDAYSMGESGFVETNALVDYMLSSLHDGLIIPINVGRSSLLRKDYLYEKIDLIISSILDSGYQIVPMETLIP